MRYIGVFLLAFVSVILNSEERIEASTLVAVQVPNASIDPYAYASAYASRPSETEAFYLLMPVQAQSSGIEEVQALELGIASDTIVYSPAQKSIPALLWIFGSVAVGFFAMLSTGSLSARQI